MMTDSNHLHQLALALTSDFRFIQLIHKMTHDKINHMLTKGLHIARVNQCGSITGKNTILSGGSQIK